MLDDNLIYVLNKTLALHQAEGGFRTSMDSVMLGAACPAQPKETVLDIGCGVGSAGLCALKRINSIKLTGIDIQADHIELATQNARINNMSEQTEFICSDIQDTNLGNKFDHVICNPPYMEAGSHIHSPSKAKAKAMGHIEDNINLKNWIACAHRHIKGQGSFTLIHDAGQIDNIIHALYGREGGKRFGGVEIIPIYPRTRTPAKRIIIRAYKHKKSPAIIHQGIIMHEKNGNYTREADDILRYSKKLF